MRFKIIFAVLLSILCSINCLSQTNSDECPIPPPQSSGPGGDACDDNYSFNQGTTSYIGINYIFNDPRVAVFNRGSKDFCFSLLSKVGNGFISINEKFDYSKITNEVDVIVIPTGGLFGLENDSIFKASLQEYIRLGGTIIVFTQQYGSQIDKIVPIPDGASLRSYGWREDQSCWSWPYNLKTMHPALATMASGSIVTDGQFSVYPSDSTILLRKGSNQEPVLLYYPYGNGTVILTSMYTDWGAAHSQTSVSELRLVRDLVTFAKNPNLAIPMYDLTANPTPNISLQVKVKNDSEYAATKVKINVYTPDRKTVLYQTESAVSLAAGAETEIPLAFTLPELTDVNLGICHTDYELYDAENNLVQMANETISGRFTPYRLKLTQMPVKNLVCWLTAKSEIVFWDENPKFVLHLRNNTDHDITESFTYEWWHGNRTPLTTLTVGPGQLLDYEFEVPLLTNIHNQSDAMESFFVHKTSNWSWQTYKGVRVVYPSFSSLSVQTPSYIRFGDAINFTVNSTNTTGKAIPGEMSVKLLNMKNIGIETLYSQTHAFGKDETFTYSGSQALANPLPPGFYYLRFGVKQSDGMTHYSFVPFSYVRSIVSIINLATIPEAYKISHFNTRLGLIPGQTYSVNFILKNSSFFAINQGRYIVTMKSESGIEVFRKEVTNIAFNASQELAFSEPFVFSPVASGKYILQVEYSDESRTAELITVCNRQYEYLMNAVMTTDKTNYHYLETVNIQLKIAGIGGFHLKVACVKAGFSEERDITVPTGEFQAIEAFQMPVGFPVFNDYKIEYEITDLTGSKLKGYSNFQVASIKMKMNGSFSAITAKVGEPLNLHLDVQGVSGFVVPLGGELLVQAPGLAFSETRPVTIEPTGSNSFDFSIPVAGTVAAGQYGVDAAIMVAGKSIYSVTYTIQILAPGMHFSEPPPTIAAGGTLPLDFINDGGKDGSYALELTLKDKQGKVMLTQSETQAIAAGGSYHLDLPLPDGLKSGKYILKQAVSETLSVKNFDLQSEFNINGVTATLNGYMLKDKYFDSETVAGKVEIVAGGNIAEGKLKARITKIKRGGIAVFKPNQYINYKEAPVWDGKSFNNKTYFVTGTGLAEFDRSTGKYIEVLGRNDLSNIYIAADGELWLATYDWNNGIGNGVLHRDFAGVWSNYTTENGLLNNRASSFIEYDNSGQKAIWVGTEEGISVFKNNAWSSYTTADGLSSNYIFQFAKDNNGQIWVWSMEGIDRFNGTSFEKMETPFDQYLVNSMQSSANGEIWMATSIISSDPDATQSKIWRYAQGNWSNWDILAISPGVFLWNLMEDDGTMWFTGDEYVDNNYVGFVIAKYNGAFTFYKSTNIPEIESAWNIIPVPGREGLYFGSNRAGYTEFNGTNWHQRLIEIENSQNDLVADTFLLASNGKDGVWAAANAGLSHFKDGNIKNYLPEIEFDSWNINSLVVAPDNAVYEFVQYENNGERGGFILKIAENGINRITAPAWNYSYYNYPILGVDDGGRLWMAMNSCSEGCCGQIYYRNGEGEWNVIDSDRYYYAYINKIIPDGSGGVWIALGNEESWNNGELIHVRNDLSYQEYTVENSGLTYNWVKDICIDASGVLWILSKQRFYEPTVFGMSGILSNYEFEAVQTLQNDVFTLKATYSPEGITPGYPASGINSIADAGEGNVVFIGGDGNAAFHQYWLSGEELLADENSFYIQNSNDGNNFGNYQCVVGSNGMIYAIGDIENTGEHNLLQIGSGMHDQEVWKDEYAINANAGQTLNLDLLPEKTLASGNYILKSELVSGLDQKLADSQYGFLVRGSAVAASISKSGAADPNIRAGMDQEITFEVLNNTAEAKPDLTMKVVKLSPSGVEIILQEGPLSLNAGQNHNGTLTFNESETGVWQLNVEVRESNTLLDSAELILKNSQPVVSHEIIYPEYAGNDAFPVKIKFANQGQIAANVHVLVGATGGSPSYLNEDVTLAVGEERILSFTDTISVDRTYDVTLSGDLVVNEQKIVKYGYVENLALNVLPQYREGGITIGYTMANAGGLPFTSALHFKLYILGTETVLYSADKTYNLYPNAEASADSLELSLAPGAYQLRWTTGRGGSGQADFSILSSGIGQLVFAPAAKYPVGLTDMAYQITNSDTVAGSIPLLIEIIPAAGGAAIYSESRNYYINAGESVSDAFSFEFVQSGNYIVRLSGNKIAGGTVAAPFKVLNLNEMTSTVAVQPAADGVVPVLLNINNTGYSDFTGTLVIEAGGLRHEEQLQVISEAVLNQAFNFDANGLSSGSQEVKAYLYDAAGNILAQNTQTVMIKNADIKMVEVPQNLAISAGAFANVTLKVKNEGNRRGEAKITMSAFDTLNETRELVLEAGEELELTDIFIDVDGDIPAGRYPFNYTLAGLGVTNGLTKGNFTFQVNGIALDVTAALDRSLYNQGETAQLTINISSAAPVTTPLEAVINWNEFSERRTFTLDNGSSSLVFEIPLAEASAAKVFYGIYQEGGRGIYLNDIYLNFAGNVSVTLDQQVYAPGDSIHALFTVGEAGSLTAECFGQSQTVAIGSSGSIAFAVPADALGGSYGVSWTFTPTDLTHETLSGSKAFDVSGLVVKVAKAELERGKYAPNDTIKAMLTLESNRDITLSLRSWTTTPEAQWTYLGEQNITLATASQTPAVLEYAFNTTEAGTHRLVYGLYREEQLVVSGAAAFDCGDAVLLGLATDHLDYPDGNETVKVKVDYFGAGTASLKLYLDDVQVDERVITLAGLGSTEIDLTAAQIAGGRHDLRAVMSKDNLTSTRSTWFGYGSNLPDLAVEAADRSNTDLNYTYTIRVSNNGKTAAPASTLVFSDNNVDKQTASVGALATAAYQDFQFNWSGSGHAGSHTLTFAVDRENAIKEYVEANNVLTMIEEVPALFYKLAIDPQLWPANSNVSIFSRLINNTETNLALQLHLTLTHNASSLNILTRDKTITLSPYTTTLETDIFNTGTYPVGDYTLRQTANSTAGALTEELSVIIEACKGISGTMTVTPTTVAAGTESQVSLHLVLHNSGNVVLENEPLTITVTNNESQEVVKSEPMTVTLALGESKTIVRDLALNLAAGVYTISLQHLDDVIAQAELTAANGLDKDKYVSRRARALFMNLLALPYITQKNYLKSVLNAGSIIYQDTSNIIESYLHFQKGENNINIVFGRLLAPYLQKELKERVQRGEGLIYIADSILADTYMQELSGVKVLNLPMAQREKNITLLPGLLGSGGSAVLLANCKLMLEVLTADTQVVGETKIGKKPILAYNEYGLGKVLTICVPLEFASNGNVFAQMVLNAVNLFNREVFSASDLARVMPMELRIKNNTSLDKIFRVQELIPQKATSYGYNPAPLAGAEIKWDVNLKVNEEKVISYWLQLPDAIGTFDIKSEIYDGAQKVDEALLTFEVVQKVADRVVEVITEINASGDTQTKKALAPLNRIKNRNGDDALTLLLNLDDAIQATDLVGKSTIDEVVLWRQQLQNVMMVYARKLYDKIKNFGIFELSAFGSRFQE
jgi:hypothetical protein